MSMPDLNSGALAPVSKELELFELNVTGSIPTELNGTLVRNGPNPLSGRFAGEDMLAWWPEAAMLHAITLREGAALSYRNRWIQTRAWGEYNQIVQQDRLLETNPNVNVISHAGEVLALAEGGIPLAINAQLDTLSQSKAHPGIGAGMTAHPKIDAQTGELLSFCSSWAEPFLRYFSCDASGATVVDQLVEVPAPAMMHDMAITKRFSLLMDLNVGYDFSLFEKGYRIPICWQQERTSRIALIPRQGGEPSWFEIDPCFVQHVVNAYDAADGSVVLDVAHYPWFLKLNSDGFEPNPLASLRRIVLDPKSGLVAEFELDDLKIELPRINEAYTGQAYRFAYAVEQPTNEEMRGVVRYDLQRQTSVYYQVSAGDQNSEPVFVPRPNANAEDDGWILVCVYRQATDTTDLVILNAQDIDGEVQATISLPCRVPAGFHGAWLPKLDG